MTFRNWIWLLPPMLGLLSWFVASASRPKPTAGVAAELRERREVQREFRDMAGVVRALEAAEAREADALQQENAEITEMSAADLQAEILRLLLQVMDPEMEFGVRQKAERRSYACAAALGAVSRQSGLAWIEEEAPDLLHPYMASWAEADPDGALRAVMESSRPSPCPRDTLMLLLKHEADSGPAALRAAVERVPWDLFHFSDDPFEDHWEPALAKGADVRPWLEGGAARALAEQGVELGFLFEHWGWSDLSGGLEGWADWPRHGGANASEQLTQLLKPWQVAENADSKIIEAFAAQDPATMAKIRQALGELRNDGPDRIASLLEKFPFLEAYRLDDTQTESPSPDEP